MKIKIIANVRLSVLPDYSEHTIMDYNNFKFFDNEKTKIFVFRHLNGVIKNMLSKKILLALKDQTNEELLENLTVFQEQNGVDVDEIVLVGNFISDDFWLNLADEVVLIDDWFPHSPEHINIYKKLNDNNFNKIETTEFVWDHIHDIKRKQNYYSKN